jgi:predicted transcriptional regulator
MKTSLSLKIDQELKSALERLAEAENRSLSNYVTTLLKAHVQAQQPAPKKPKK